MTVIPPEWDARSGEPKHECDLPWQAGGYGSTGYPEGTLWQCPECGCWYCTVPCYQSFGPVTIWLKVLWIHWRLRRRIAQFEAQRAAERRGLIDGLDT